MDVLALMKQGHDQIRSDLRDVTEAKGVKNRRQAVVVCDGHLRVQFALEKDYLYPEVTDLYAGSDHLIKVGLASGVAIKRKLSQLVKMSAEPQTKQAGFETKWDNLSQTVEKHLSVIEDQLMPRMRASIRTEDREDLGQLFLEVRDELAAALHELEAPSARTRKRA